MDFGLWTRTLDYELWTMNFELWTLDYRLWTSVFGLRTLDFGLRTLDFRLWTLDFGLWTSDFGLWTSDIGLWTLDFGLWTLDYILWTSDNGVGECSSQFLVLLVLQYSLSTDLVTISIPRLVKLCFDQPIACSSALLLRTFPRLERHPKLLRFEIELHKRNIFK